MAAGRGFVKVQVTPTHVPLTSPATPEIRASPAPVSRPATLKVEVGTATPVPDRRESNEALTSLSKMSLGMTESAEQRLVDGIIDEVENLEAQVSVLPGWVGVLVLYRERARVSRCTLREPAFLVSWSSLYGFIVLKAQAKLNAFFQSWSSSASIVCSCDSYPREETCRLESYLTCPERCLPLPVCCWVGVDR